jgi:predicted nucleic acid-binding protein
VKKKIVLDSFALLAYLKEETGFEKVKTLLTAEDIHAMINDINVGEAYYIIARERGSDQADYFADVILPSLPVTLVSNTLTEVVEAARIKAKYSLSYAHCFAAATAYRENAPLITGDPEFKKVRNIIEIDWI